MFFAFKGINVILQLDKVILHYKVLNYWNPFDYKLVFWTIAMPCLLLPIMHKWFMITSKLVIISWVNLFTVCQSNTESTEISPWTCMFYPVNNTIFFTLNDWMHKYTKYMCPILERRSKTENEVKTLMKSFKANPYPGRKERHQLAKSLNTSQRAIEQWFTYMRRKKSKEGFLKTSEY